MVGNFNINDKETVFNFDFNDSILVIIDNMAKEYAIKSKCSLKQLEEEFADIFLIADQVLLIINKLFYANTYRYDDNKKVWQLVDQGEGWL